MNKMISAFPPVFIAEDEKRKGNKKNGTFVLINKESRKKYIFLADINGDSVFYDLKGNLYRFVDEYNDFEEIFTDFKVLLKKEKK